MYAWSGLLQSGLAGFIIGVGISFIPPFVILWDARNNYKDKKNKELEKEIEEAKQREALKIENEQREANGEKPKEIIKKKRARKITKEEKLVIVKAILDSNMNDFEKIKTKFDVGRSIRSAVGNKPVRGYSMLRLREWTVDCKNNHSIKRVIEKHQLNCALSGKHAVQKPPCPATKNP